MNEVWKENRLAIIVILVMILVFVGLGVFFWMRFR